MGRSETWGVMRDAWALRDKSDELPLALRDATHPAHSL
jgi:hypothetical protein